jgi:hypothetical protein
MNDQYSTSLIILCSYLNNYETVSGLPGQRFYVVGIIPSMCILISSYKMHASLP